MKTLYQLLAVCIFACTMSYGQSNTSFGIKGAVNLGELKDIPLGDKYKNTKRISYATGLFINQKLSPHSNIQIEALYSEMGSDLDHDSDPSYTYQLNYASLPILYRFHFKADGNLHLQLGVVPSYLVNAKLKIEAQDATDVLDLEDYFKDNGTDTEVNPFDFAVTAGLGLGLPHAAVLTVSYSYGLTDVFKGADAPTGIRNTLIQVGFCFDLIN